MGTKAVMRLQDIAAGVTIGVAVAGFAAFLGATVLDYGPLETKKNSRVMKKTLTDSLLKLAECVDDPKYEIGSDQAIRDPSCQERVLKELRKWEIE